MEFGRTPILSDLRVLELYEAAMRHEVEDVAAARELGSPYGPEDDARLFATAQFRRYRELADRHLPRLADTTAIRRHLKGEQP